MAAKDSLTAKLKRWNWHSIPTGEVTMQASALLRSADVGIHFTLAAICSGASIFGGYAPFGVSLVGAAGSGVCGAAALLGAVFGYFALMGFVDGLRYASAAILTFSVQFAFYDLKALRHPWVMPACAGFLTGCTSFIYLSEHGWRTVDVIYFLLECFVTAGGCWCYRQLLLPLRCGHSDRILSPQRRVSLVFLLCTLLIALSPISLFGHISLGRTLAIVMVLAVAWQGNCTSGAVLGLIAGLSMDIAANSNPMYAMAFGISGLCAGFYHHKKRRYAALAYMLTNSAAVLWTWEYGLPISILYETVLASIGFLLLPERPLRRLGIWLIPEAAPSTDHRQLVQKKLEATAQAFRTLYETMRTGFRPPSNDNDIATIFDRAACRVCKFCTLCADCWEKNYVTTFNALNDATQAMLERGQGEAGDFPQYFSSRCIHFAKFLSAVNQELTALLYRRQYQHKIQQSRLMVCSQYGEMASLLGKAATELSEELVPEPRYNTALHQFLLSLGGEWQGCTYRDSRGLLWVELSGLECQLLASSNALSQLMSLFPVPMRMEEQLPNRLILVQQEPFMAIAGVAAQKKDGETVSGDAGTYFKRSDGTLYVLLCDGMGSGIHANRESTLALRLLEQFLQAGMETEHALKTLNTALALREEELGAFTTIDLLQLNLYTGDGILFKFGAAPTYLKKGSTIRRITGTSLPAGLSLDPNTNPDRTPIHLNAGDCVLMISDGVCSIEDDQWIRELFSAFTGESPKELAKQLLTQSPQTATDDRTALVVQLMGREKSA